MRPQHLPSSQPHRTTRALSRVVLPSLLLGVALVSGVARGGAQERVTPVPLAAPSSAPAPWDPPVETVAWVRAALAEQWGVLPEALVLEWGTPRGGTLPEGLAPVGLLGSGRDGRLVVSLGPAAGGKESFSLLLRAGVSSLQMVSSRTLERGEALKEGDVEYQTLTRWGPPEGSERSPEVGWIPQRRIAKGEALRSPMLRPPLLVVSGQPVRAVWAGSGVEVALQGTAVSSGSMGDRVFLRTDSGRRLEGVVDGPGLVRISNPTTEIET